MLTKERRKVWNIKTKMTPENKCGFCVGTKCCSYITQSIETPRSKDDFHHMLWQLTHENVQAYKDEDGWFLLFLTRCRFVGADGRCGIYEDRPNICRDYDNDFCEYDAPAEEGFELFFDGYESFLKYCRKRFKSWDQSYA